MNLRLIFRNETSRDDAVYIITATTQNGVITVAGEWGKWNAFRKAGKLQWKVYYTSTSETRVRGMVRQMQQLKRYQRAYIPQPHRRPTSDNHTAACTGQTASAGRFTGILCWNSNTRRGARILSNVE